ncbi:MAG: tetratricopeptide repeat protein, partial [Anaerolineae bacterium]|nr:tetratricopeptide repeat protein [Anaerolineae bacterium]
FVAAYRIMVVPLTLGRLFRVIGATLDADDPPLAHFILIPFYVLVLVGQLMAIVFAQSRGPWLGLLGGLFFFALLGLFELRRRWPRLAIPAVSALLGLSALVFGFLVVFNLPNSPLAPLRSAPYIGRLGRILVDNPTGDVRILIWRGAADLVLSDPARLLTGYGPETMQVAYNPFYPPDLAHIESRNASPDRSHNETWDALITTGLIGFLSYMALFTSIFYLGLKWLGFIQSRRQRNLFLVLWFGGGIVASVAFVTLGEPGYFGVALPVGMMAGLFLYLVAYAVYLARQLGTLQEASQAANAEPYRWLIIALYTAMMAHFIEIHFGIAIAATRTYFWMYAALLVAAGYLWRSRPGLAPAAEVETRPADKPVVKAEERGGAKTRDVETKRRSPERRSGGRVSRRPVSATSADGWQPRDVLVMGLLVGIMLAVMLFDFYAPAAGIDFNWKLVWLFSFSWVFATPIALSEGTRPLKTGAEWAKALGLYVAVSLLAVPLPYLVLQNLLFARPTADGIAAVPVPLSVYLTLCALALGLLLRREDGWPTAWIAGARAVVYPTLAFVVGWLIWTTNLRVVSADILYKQAWVNYHQRRQYNEALKLYDEALRDQPTQDFYLLFKGKALLEKAQATTDPTQREATMQEARGVLEQARALNPLNTDHTANLARMYQTWASYSAPQRDQLLQKSLQYYEEAAALSPNSALILNQWSSAYLDLGQTDQALKLLDRSLELDTTFQDTYLRLMDTYAQLDDMNKVESAYQQAVKLNPRSVDPHMVMGDIYRLKQDNPKAVEAYRRAVEADPRSATARSSLALVLAQTGQRDQAIQENLEVLKLAPNDLSTLKNLAILYREGGRLNDALAYARKAQELSPRDADLIQFVKELEQQGAK